MDTSTDKTTSLLEMNIQRVVSANDGTFGILHIPSLKWSCATLEQPDRDNAPNISRIPAGTYNAVWTWSPRFGRATYRLQDVTGRVGILIHQANFAGDTKFGWYTELHGCIALGSHVAKLRNPLGDMQKAISLSRHTTREFENLCKQAPLQITITDETNT